MKPILFLSLAASMLLVGCNANTANIVAEVQAATTVACSVEPTAASVAALIAASNAAASAGVSVASQIASQICAAIPKKPGSSRDGVPAPVVVNGVIVKFQSWGNSK